MVTGEEREKQYLNKAPFVLHFNRQRPIDPDGHVVNCLQVTMPESGWNDMSRTLFIRAEIIKLPPLCECQRNISPEQRIRKWLLTLTQTRVLNL